MSPHVEALARVGLHARTLYDLRDWRGDCYHVAACLATAFRRPIRGLRLAHGTALGLGGEAKGKRYGHAWVELGALVFDVTVRPEPFDLRSYYALGNLDGVRLYRPSEARRWLARSTHYGPWES